METRVAGIDNGNGLPISTTHKTSQTEKMQGVMTKILESKGTSDITVKNALNVYESVSQSDALMYHSF